MNSYAELFLSFFLLNLCFEIMKEYFFRHNQVQEKQSDLSDKVNVENSEKVVKFKDEWDFVENELETKNFKSNNNCVDTPETSKAKVSLNVDEIPRNLQKIVLEERRRGGISAKSKKNSPTELNFSTYETVFKSLINLEEQYIRNEFRSFTKEVAYFRKVSQVYQLEFEGLHEMRPSILRGSLAHLHRKFSTSQLSYPIHIYCR